ncbi:hypothetical protein ACFSQ3_07695 [Sphingobacterium corticis]|uniref:Uncharacterized protein n=1 Tax=Sphingobacterium corticis TaxID=1812823 RepID=A0ABW5NJN8_9SPHI
MKPILLFCALILGAQFAEARLKVPVGKVEKINIVHDLPDTDDFRVSDGGKLLDLATIHEEFNIAWVLPLWVTKEPRLILSDAEKDIYYDLTNEQLDEIVRTNNLDKDDLLGLPFYTRYGGKVVGAILLGFIVYGLVGGGKNEDTQDEGEVPDHHVENQQADRVADGHTVAATNTHVASADEPISEIPPASEDSSNEDTFGSDSGKQTPDRNF